jgi:hypothetical protein
MKNSAFLPILLLAACNQPAGEPATNQPANVVTENVSKPPGIAVPSLVGQRTIATIKGSAPDQIWPMVAQVTADSFRIRSECRTIAWTFRQDRNVVQLGPDPGSSVDCPRVRSPAEELIAKPVGLANIAMFSDEGRQVELSGPGGRVTMTRR